MNSQTTQLKVIATLGDACQDKQGSSSTTQKVPLLEIKQSVPFANTAKNLLLRQAVLNQDNTIVAYELQHQDNARPAEPYVDAGAGDGEHSGNEYTDQQMPSGKAAGSIDRATSQVIASAFSEIDLDQAAFGKPVFISFTQNWLLNPPPFNPLEVIIKVIQGTPTNSKVIESLKRLKAGGFRIAFDNFDESKQSLDALLLADILIIDMSSTSKKTSLVRLKEICGTLDRVKQHKPTLLAENIDDQQTKNFCIEHGFSLLQGFYFDTPAVVQSTSAFKLNALQLLTELQSPALTLNRLEYLLLQNPLFTVKFLHLFNEHRQIPLRFERLIDALSICGVPLALRWINVIVINELGQSSRADLTVCLARAHLCELLAREIFGGATDDFFLLGLYSNLSVFFLEEPRIICEAIGLKSDHIDAICDHQGRGGELIHAAKSLALKPREQRRATSGKSTIDLSQGVQQELYRESIFWAKNTRNLLRS